MDEIKNYFKDLAAVDVNDHVEPKGRLKYLSWVWAWSEIKKRDPAASFVIHQNEALGMMPYFTDGRTAFVKVSVTAFGQTITEMLPVMDNYNKSIPLDKMTSFDVNNSIKRCMTKAIALHGLGLYIYAGEDLPDTDEPSDEPKPKPATAPKNAPQAASGGVPTIEPHKCSECGKEIDERVFRYSMDNWKRPLCRSCQPKGR